MGVSGLVITYSLVFVSKYPYFVSFIFILGLQYKKHKFIIARGEATESKQGFIRAYKKDIIPKSVCVLIDAKYIDLIKMINGYIRFLNKQNNDKPN